MNFLKKWYTYQKERFPILTYGMYILCVVFATFCFCDYSGMQYNEYIKDLVFIIAPSEYTTNFWLLIPMFIVALLQFLEIRISDEFKDYEEDLKYRPYRPVQRGLVTLKELKILLIICMAIQFIITLIFNKDALIALGCVWIAFFLLSKDFFLKKFLEKHMLLNVTLDELLMPVLVLYLASYVCIGPNIFQLLLISYLISWIVELARKIRAKEDEEEGVKTYTAVFGINKAMHILIFFESLLMLVHAYALKETNFSLIPIGLYAIVSVCNILFIAKKNKKTAKLVELSSNAYIMLVYLSFAVLL